MADGAAAPAQDSASVTLLIGERDAFLGQAKLWATRVAAAVTARQETGVFLQVMPQKPLALAKHITALAARAATGKLTPATLDAHLGGLRGHSLAFLTHGLEGDTDDAGGLLLFKGGTARTELMFFHLSFMVVEDGKVVGGKNDEGQVIDPTVPKEEGDELSNAQVLAQVQERVPVVQAIRDGAAWERVLLFACGASSHDPTAPVRLTSFAKRLAKLTGKQVFFNQAPIWLTTGPKPFAEVGKKKPDGTVAIASGTAWTNGASVTLQSTDTNLLEGSQVRT